MSSVIRFVKMDWLTFKPYRKYFSVLSLLFIFIFIANAHAVSLSVLTSMMAAGMLPSYLFAGEDKSGMARLYAALPIYKKEVVIGRYLGGITIGLGCIISAALLMAVDSMVTSSFSFQDVINAFSLAIGIFFIFIAIQFPILFQFGFIKAQNFTMLLPAICLLAVNLFWSKAYYQAMSHLSSMTGLVFLLIGLTCFLVSLRVSMLIYQAKEQ